MPLLWVQGYSGQKGGHIIWGWALPLGVLEFYKIQTLQCTHYTRIWIIPLLSWKICIQYTGCFKATVPAVFFENDSSELFGENIFLIKPLGDFNGVIPGYLSKNTTPDPLSIWNFKVDPTFPDFMGSPGTENDTIIRINQKRRKGIKKGGEVKQKVNITGELKKSVV